MIPAIFIPGRREDLRNYTAVRAGRVGISTSS